jgi:hypothetical protein
MCSFIDELFCIYFHSRTWYVGGGTVMRQTRGALQGCIYAGLIYAAIETLPVAILGSELPCGSCGTEEWSPPHPLPVLFSFGLNRGLYLPPDFPTDCALSPCVCLLVATILL